MKKQDNLSEDILLCLSKREWFDRWYPVLQSDFMKDLEYPQRIGKAFAGYYKETESEEIDPGFVSWATMTRAFPKAHLPEIERMTHSFIEIRSQFEPDEAFARRLEHEAQVVAMERLIKDYKSGKAVDFSARMNGIVDAINSALSAERVEPAKLDVESILNRDKDSTTGLYWPMRCLNDAMMPVEEGDMGIIAASPGKGKSSLIAHIATYFAPQCPSSRPILWFNNEGKETKIVERVYQAALQVEFEDLRKWLIDGTLEEKYQHAVGGRRIDVIGIDGMYPAQLEAIIKDKKPRVVIFDMMDKVKFENTGHDGATRTDQILEQKYDWARALAKKYNFTCLATSQISAEGFGQRFPAETCLKDTKVGKQGACDFIVMMGSDEIGDGSGSRYISVPKNKLPRPNGKHANAHVYFDAGRCTFVEGH